MKISKKLIVLLGLCALMAGLLVINGCAPRERAGSDTSGGTYTTSDEDGEGGGSGGVPAMTIEWSPQSDCAMCHSAEELTRNDTVTTAGMHNPSAISAQVDCMTCHDDVSGLTKAHDGVLVDDKAATRLRTTKVSIETCTASGCHDDEAARKEATAGLTLLTDSEGTTVNPHDLPTGEGHSAITCSSCHKGHEATEADKFCITCHHEHVYACGTCH
jgi:hypothetical protein